MAVPPSQELGELGPYVLLEQIAVGGMAEIYLAKTRGVAGFEKFLCLKIIHPNYADDQHFIEMLIDEAKIAVGLNHVNIVQIFDLGREGRTYFIAMEYIDGADLFRVMRRLSEREIDVPIDVASYIAQEICTGLDYAHRKRDEEGRPLGIIHRDISPQNILLSHSGEVKIVDFGIAKAASRSRRTQAGVIKGKYYYMSPEQAWGDPVDQRTDIFSCGIILYEVLTGQMLYLEEDMHQLLDMVRKADIPRPSTRRPDIPPQLETIVMKALAKRPADRWQTAHEFQAALTNFLFSFAPAYTPARVSRLLELALSEERKERPSRERPATRQVQLMSRVDFRPITEHSVIFPVSDLIGEVDHTDESRAAPETLPDDEDRTVDSEEDETVDEEDRGERTVISGPPSMMDSSPRLRGERTGGATITDPGEVLTSAQFREALPVQQYREALPVKPNDWEEEGPTLLNKNSGPRPQDLDLGRPRRKSRSIPVEIVVPRAQQTDPRPPTLTENTPTPVVDFSAPTLHDAPNPTQPPEPRQTRPSSSMRPAVPPPIPPPPPERQRALTGPAPLVRPPGWPTGPQPPVPAQPGWPPQPLAQTLPPSQPGWPTGGNWQQQQQQQWPQPPPQQWPQQQQQQQWPQQQQQQWPPQQQQPWPPQQQQPWPQPQQSAPSWPPVQQPPPQTWPPVQQPPPQTWPPVQQQGWPSPQPQPAPPLPVPADGGFGGHTDLLVEQAQAASRRRRRWRTRVLAALLGVTILGVAGTLILFLLPSDEVGKVNVISVPEGASVLFDGRLMEKTAPVVIAVPELGRQHTVEVRLKNYKPYQHTLVFGEGESSQQVLAVLTPIFGRLEVRSTPEDADVIVDSTHRGRTPLIIENLTPTGEITVELRRRGYKPISQVLRWEDRTYLMWDPVLKRSQ